MISFISKSEQYDFKTHSLYKMIRMLLFHTRHSNSPSCAHVTATLISKVSQSRRNKNPFTTPTFLKKPNSPSNIGLNLPSRKSYVLELHFLLVILLNNNKMNEYKLSLLSPSVNLEMSFSLATSEYLVYRCKILCLSLFEYLN